MIDMFSLADIPDKTGLGSSSTFLVGLLNALHTLRGDNFPVENWRGGFSDCHQGCQIS